MDTAQLVTDEIARLTNDELGFPYPLASHLARRAAANGWLPVRDPMLPAGPGNVVTPRGDGTREFIHSLELDGYL